MRRKSSVGFRTFGLATWGEADRPAWADRVVAPLAWFLPGLACMRGAQRATSLATGFFTGESTWKPLHGSQSEILL